MLCKLGRIAEMFLLCAIKGLSGRTMSDKHVPDLYQTSLTTTVESRYNAIINLKFKSGVFCSRPMCLLCAIQFHSSLHYIETVLYQVQNLN